jgi:dipeptidase E
MSGHIVAMGGRSALDDGRASLLALDEHLLSLTAEARPHVVYLPTATGDSDWAEEWFEAAYGAFECTRDIVETFGVPDRPAERVAAADAVLVAGGNTANMLAVWRLHGVDDALRDMWERGAVLGGASAGANCWFEACVTDSFSAELDGLDDGLGFLAGSFCPHFDGEERRRPVYTRLAADGFPAGIACDDGAAAVYRGTELVEVVADRTGPLGYRVSASGVEPLPTRVLP